MSKRRRWYFNPDLEQWKEERLNTPLQVKPFTLPNRVILCKISRLSDPKYHFNLVHTALVTFAKYDNFVFPANVSRCHRSKVTLSFFSSGKLIGTGCRSQQHGLYAARLLIETLSREFNLNDLYISQMSMPNLVGHCSLGYWLNMEEMRRAMGCTGNNDVPGDSPFPGMTIRCNELDITFIVFANGKINSTGLKRDDPEYIQQIINQHRIFERFRINDDDESTSDSLSLTPLAAPPQQKRART